MTDDNTDYHGPHLVSDWSDVLKRARERLHAEREEVFNRQEELQRKIAEINREFAAIEAYETAKTGKVEQQAPAGRQQRARRGSRQEELLELIRQSEGLSRGEILERMGLKGDRSGEVSVSNALAALTKRDRVRREGRKYISPDQSEAELPLDAPEGDQPPEADGGTS